MGVMLECVCVRGGGGRDEGWLGSNLPLCILMTIY